MTTQRAAATDDAVHELRPVALRRLTAAILDGLISLIAPAAYLTSQMVLRELATSADAARRCNLINDLSSDFCFHSGTQVLTGTETMLGTAAVIWAVALVVHHGLLSGITGWTLGKLMTGLRVVHASRLTRAGLLANLIRTLSLVIDAFPYGVPLVGPLAILISSQHQRLGDRLARTRVVQARDRRPAATPEATGAEPAVAGPAATTAGPAATTPGVGAPLWDPDRDTYIQWDPELEQWMEWSVEYDLWVPISR